MTFPDNGPNYEPRRDDGLRQVLAALGARDATYLGHGGEAAVYALDGSRVVRVLWPGGRLEDIAQRQALVAELGRSTLPFALPEVLTAGEVDGRAYAIEKRLRGTSANRLLASKDGREREDFVVAYLEAAAALGDLALDPRPWYGELVGRSPVRAGSWGEFLAARATTSLASAGSRFAGADGAALARDLDHALPIDGKSFVHLDAFTGNLLAEGSKITAVLDIGYSSLAGDRRLDPLSAVAYLASVQITPEANQRDVDVAMAWLDGAGLAGAYLPALRWLAGYWAFAAPSDPAVEAWCAQVLRGP